MRAIRIAVCVASRAAAATPRDGLAALNTETGLSMLGSEPDSSSGLPRSVEQFNTQVNTSVPPGNPTPIADFDVHIQVEVTAAKVK